MPERAIRVNDRPFPLRRGRLLRVAAACVALSGCYSKPLSVSPAEEPSFKGMDYQLAEARLRNFLSDHGTITMLLPKGETCSGTWTTDKRRFATVASSSLLGALGHEADRTISTVGNEPTSRNGRASLFCDNGSTVQMDFVTRRGTADGYGVARDSGGRHYLIKFGWP